MKMPVTSTNTILKLSSGQNTYSYEKIPSHQRFELQEPIGAALYAVVLLKAVASTIPEVDRDDKEEYLVTATEFEQAAVGLLEQMTNSDSVSDYEELPLVRTMPQFFNYTALELAWKGNALKFISSTQVQVNSM